VRLNDTEREIARGVPAIKTIYDDAPGDNPEHIIATTLPASDEAVADVTAADPTSGNGRSEWLWVRLANGDLILGVFPQGDTYFTHEEEFSG